ncbi:MAG: NAD(P)-binding domain-containing protein [Lewinellaceae bacterium]|nr:NAD(P)-binding domain-containing protein [Saprospiraceae bacterium]MCB9338641.1 NAD(P)-binding domain-containing protein [Lewinellaceae bacterium]
MNIAIIGTGNVGGALASAWATAGHRIYLGVRDTNNFKGADLLAHQNTTAHPIPEAVAAADVVLLAAAPQFTQSIVAAMGDVKGKIIIDAMNSLRSHPEGYANSFDALKSLAPGAEVVKCFNTTGFENMKDPSYGGEGVDMFVAGSSKRGKEVAVKLAKDCGFGECWDFGGDDKAGLLEQLAFCWINLAIMQGHGRGMAFKLVKR